MNMLSGSTQQKHAPFTSIVTFFAKRSLRAWREGLKEGGTLKTVLVGGVEEGPDEQPSFIDELSALGDYSNPLLQIAHKASKGRRGPCSFSTSPFRSLLLKVAQYSRLKPLEMGKYLDPGLG